MGCWDLVGEWGVLLSLDVEFEESFVLFGDDPEGIFVTEGEALGFAMFVVWQFVCAEDTEVLVFEEGAGSGGVLCGELEFSDGGGAVGEDEEVAGFGAYGDVAEVEHAAGEGFGEGEEFDVFEVGQREDADASWGAFVDGDEFVLSVGGEMSGEELEAFPSFVGEVSEVGDAAELLGGTGLDLALVVFEGDGEDEAGIFAEEVGGVAVVGEAESFEAGEFGVIFGSEQRLGVIFADALEVEALFIVDHEEVLVVECGDAAGFFEVDFGFVVDGELGGFGDGEFEVFDEGEDGLGGEFAAAFADELVDECAFGFGDFFAGCGAQEDDVIRVDVVAML